MILDLPFAYQAGVLPTRKHRKPRARTLRGYTPVKIPDVASHEVSEAVVFKESTSRNLNGTAGWMTVISYGGRLFRPVIVNGRPLTGTDLEQAVGPTQKFGLWTDGSATVAARLPHPGMRMDAAMSPAMLHNTFEREMAIDDFGDPQLVKSNEEFRRAEAQNYYSKAVMTLDGVLHVETSEPVWHVVVEGENSAVELELAPRLMEAGSLFRLDGLDRATAFARSFGRLDDVARRATVTIVEPEALVRNDMHELARNALAHQHSLYVLFAGLPGEPRYNWRNFPNDQFFLSDVEHPHGDVAIEILERMERCWTRIETELPDRAVSSYYGPGIAGVVRRWAFDKEYGLPWDADTLDGNDLEALSDIT